MPVPLTPTSPDNPALAEIPELPILTADDLMGFLDEEPLQYDVASPDMFDDLDTHEPTLKLLKYVEDNHDMELRFLDFQPVERFEEVIEVDDEMQYLDNNEPLPLPAEPIAEAEKKDDAQLLATIKVDAEIKAKVDLKALFARINSAELSVTVVDDVKPSGVSINKPTESAGFSGATITTTTMTLTCTPCVNVTTRSATARRMARNAISVTLVTTNDDQLPTVSTESKDIGAEKSDNTSADLLAMATATTVSPTAGRVSAVTVAGPTTTESDKCVTKNNVFTIL